MSIIKAFWEEFISAFRAARKGGEASEASRRNIEELREELKEERDVQRIAQRWANAKSDSEQKAVLDEIKTFVIEQPKETSGASRRTKKETPVRSSISRNVGRAYQSDTQEEIDRAKALAREIMGRECAALGAEMLEASAHDKSLLSAALPFLWGVFCELVKEYPHIPTNGYDRVKDHLANYLVDVHGYSLNDARTEALSVEKQYNMADEFFDELAALGRKTFHDHRTGRLSAMVKNLHEINENLAWSDDPGTHEAHLRKRHNNPYFPEARRVISQNELLEAKINDREALKTVLNQFKSIMHEGNIIYERIENGNSTIDIDDFHSLREHIDDVMQQAMIVGGPAKELAAKLDQLRDLIILTIRDAYAGDEEALERIEIADTYHRDHVRKFFVPFVAQFLSDDHGIPEEDIIPAILSEDPWTISLVLDILPDGSREEIRLATLRLMKQALDEGYRDPDFDEKLSVLAPNENELE